MNASAYAKLILAGYEPLDIFLHREDLDVLGFDGSSVTNNQMETLAAKLKNTIMEQTWDDLLRETANEMGISKNGGI